jgi:hypothetical protein
MEGSWSGARNQKAALLHRGYVAPFRNLRDYFERRTRPLCPDTDVRIEHLQPWPGCVGEGFRIGRQSRTGMLMLGVLSASAHGHRCSQLLLRGRRSNACRLGRCVTCLAIRTRLPPTARLTKIGLSPYRKMKINGQEPYNSQTKTSGWEPNRSIAVRTLDRAGREIEPSAQAMSSRRDLSTPKSESRLPCYGEAVLHDDLTSPNWTSSWCRPPCLVLLKCSWEVGPRREDDGRIICGEAL